MSTSSSEQASKNLLLSGAVNTANTLIPLRSLRYDYLEDLKECMSVRAICKGERIFNVGDRDNVHVYLQVGDVRLCYPSGYVEKISAANQLTPLVHIKPRPCEAIADTDCWILSLDSELVDRSLCWSQTADYLLAELSCDRSRDGDMYWIETVINSNLFFKVPPVNAEQILDKMKPVTVYAGETLIREGEIGDCCYFIKRGRADILVATPGKSGLTKIAEISEGRCFGEDALVYDNPRNATVRMTSDGELMRLDIKDFELLLKEPVVEEISMEEISQLKESPILVDVRTEDEYNAGHLSYSANIPLSLMCLKKRLLNPARPYVFYCDTGRRSQSMAYLLGKQGYNVVALRGGLSEQKLHEVLVVEDAYSLREGELVQD